MKIAYLSTFYPFRGGIAQFNASLFREFEKQHSVKAYTFKTQYPNFLFPGTSQFVTKDDIAEKIPAERILNTINPFSYISAANKIKKFEPDVLIMKFWMPFFAPALGWVAKSLRKKNTKIISILDNVIPHEKRPGDIAFTKFFLKQNDYFITMSEKVTKDLLTLKPTAKYKFNLHPLYDHFGEMTAKNEAKIKLAIPTDKIVLLFFGFIREYKGLDLLIKALATLPSDYHLIIAGEVYGNFDKYQKIIDDLKLQSRITMMVRYISDSEVPLLFSAADVCVLPYKSATQSGIVGISYHFNLPLIATDVGGLKEMIEPYQTGLMVNTPDVEPLQQKIQEYFQTGKIEQYVQNIIKFKELASWKKLAENILQFDKY